jgi:excisionase family DNA binding protein
MPADAKARPDTAQDKEGQVVHVPQLLPARPEALSGLEAAFLTFLQASLLEPRQVAVSLPPGVPVERRIFLSLAESAQFSGLPAGYLRKLMAEGMVKAVRTGAGWRIPRTELERLAETLTKAPPVLEELSEAQERDLEMNKLRRQGLLPPS